MKEIIEWHKYPDVEPKVGWRLVQILWEESTIHGIRFDGDKWILNERNLMGNVIAWAEMPKGVSNES